MTPRENLPPSHPLRTPLPVRGGFWDRLGRPPHTGEQLPPNALRAINAFAVAIWLLSWAAAGFAWPHWSSWVLCGFGVLQALGVVVLLAEWDWRRRRRASRFPRRQYQIIHINRKLH